MIRKTYLSQSGQALVTLLFLMVIGITVVSAAAAITFVTATSGSLTEDGTIAYNAAEAGMENAIIRMLRSPTTYTGETFNIGGANVVTQVGNGFATTSASFNNTIRKIQIQIVYTNNVLSVSSWKEIK